MIGEFKVPFKSIKAKYDPEPGSLRFASGSLDTDIVLESDFYFKADVDPYVAGLLKQIDELKSRLGET